MGKRRAVSRARLSHLMREAATLARASEAVFGVIDDAVVAAIGVVDDPVLAGRVRRANRLNLEQWLTRTILEPARMPEYQPTQEILRTARENARVGLGEAALEAFRAGQAAAWAGWTQIVFELTDDVQELRAVLEFSHESISRYVAQGAGVIRAENARGLADLAEGGPERRRVLVQQILDGQPFEPGQASRQLDYRLDQTHQALIVWGATPATEPAELDRAVTALAELVPEASLLSIVDDRIRRWVWCPVKAPLSMPEVEGICSQGVRVAVGPVARGVDGFRQSHDGARVAQAMLANATHELRLASYEDVRLPAVFLQDHLRARRLVAEILGGLEDAPEHLRDALHTFLREGENVTKAAKALRVHRNTMMRQLAQAEALLPRPLSRCRIDVAAALEIQRWLPVGD